MVSEATSREVDERLGEANGNVKLMLSNFLGIKEELEQMKKQRDEGLIREVVEIQNHIKELSSLCQSNNNYHYNNSSAATTALAAARARLHLALVRTGNNCKNCHEQFPLNDIKRDQRCIHCWNLLKCYRCHAHNMGDGDTEQKKELWRIAAIVKLRSPGKEMLLMTCGNCASYCRRCGEAKLDPTHIGGVHPAQYCHNCKQQ